MIDRMHIEQVISSRNAMLTSLKNDVESTLFEAIAKKIEYERESLNAIVESEEKKAAAEKTEVRALSPEYFTLKRLAFDI